MDRRNAGTALALLLATTVTSKATADEPAVVRVVVPACTAGAFDLATLDRAITLELRAGGAERVEIVNESAAPGTTVVATITLDAEPCSDQARAVDVIIVDELTRKTVRRRLTIDDLAPDGRSRVLALAAAELLRASWGELTMADAPKGVLPVPPSIRLASMDPDRRSSTPNAASPMFHADPVPPTLHAESAPPSLRVDAAVEGRFFPTYGSALVGPSVALSLGSATRIPLRVRVDAKALFGTSFDPLGTISVDLVAGGIAIVLAHHAGPFDIEVGPHIEAGWGRVSGNPTSATTVGSSGTGAVVDASAVLAFRMALGGAFSASLASDVGGVLYGVNAAASDGGRAAGLGGPVAGVAIGVGRSF